MVGIKRDHSGKTKENMAQDLPRNAYTSMFETFRDELDEHHDRRQRIGKVSRDVTALSKKIIFSLQRVRTLKQSIHPRIASETEARVQEIKELLATNEADVQGINRYRYPLICLEEYVEAVSFLHYLEHQTLITPAKTQETLQVGIPFTPNDYIFGIFDLTGEMMRFATANSSLNAALLASADGRSILSDVQEVSSMMQIVPALKTKGYEKKIDVMIEQVKKVEKIGYNFIVRGSERPKGWQPDMNESAGGRTEQEISAD